MSITQFLNLVGWFVDFILFCFWPAMQFFQDYIKRLLDWQKLSSQFIGKSVDLCENFDAYIDVLNALIEEAYGFSVKLPEIEMLKKVSLWQCHFLDTFKSVPGIV